MRKTKKLVGAALGATLIDAKHDPSITAYSNKARALLLSVYSNKAGQIHKHLYIF